jgi:hypothetical protein
MMTMMRFPVFLLASLLCPSLTSSAYTLPTEDMGKFHGDHTCNRLGYNTFKESMQRHLTYRKFKPTGYSAVPNQRTIMCPESVQDLHASNSPITNGYDTVWIVENTASDPVVLSYINPVDGIEYSAMNAKITPPHHDEQAILQPGQWRAVYTWEGHVFLARQLLEDAKSLGPVLLQHRTGLIPIGIQAQELICPSSDPEPVVNGTRAPEFTRTPSAINRMCNTIDLGFRNMANCPLHGYYVSSSSSSSAEEDANAAPSYTESFKFHLGMNGQKPADFMWGWDSATKFEGTFVGHSFAFRLAADPSVLVQTYTVQPTRIPDCPNLKNKPQVNRVTSTGMAQAVVLPNPTASMTMPLLLEAMTTTSFTNNATHSTTSTRAWTVVNGTSTGRARGRRRMVGQLYTVNDAASMASAAAVFAS